MTLPLPTIEAADCTGCGACVAVCPTGALVQVADKARLQYPDLCTYCVACERVCPTDAIALPWLIVFGKPGPRNGQHRAQGA